MFFKPSSSFEEMKYSEFYKQLTGRLDGLAYIGPEISLILNGNGFLNKTWIASEIDQETMACHRYAVFPVKLFGRGKIHHLNLMILDRKTKTLERYEPLFSPQDANLLSEETSKALESFMYRLMYHEKIYFLKYKTSLNTDNSSDGKNCGVYCIKYAFEKIAFYGF